jgi:hypothetical protein
MNELRPRDLSEKWLREEPHAFVASATGLDVCAYNYDHSFIHSPAAYCTLPADAHEAQP